MVWFSYNKSWQSCTRANAREMTAQKGDTMNEPVLQVQMLGKFAIRCGDRVISDDDNRSRKV